MEKKEKKTIFSIIGEKLKIGEGKKLSNKVKNILVVVLVIAILVIFSTSFITADDKQKTSKVDNTNLSATEYCMEVENRLVSVLENVKGIGKVEAFVMVDSSPTIKYLEETTTTKNEGSDTSAQTIQTTIVMAKNGTITSPVVVVEIMPKITGVLIVASGAKDVKLKTTLINVVSSVLSVDISKVEVLEGKA